MFGRKKVVTLEEVKKNAKVLEYNYKHIIFKYEELTYIMYEDGIKGYFRGMGESPHIFKEGIYEALNESRPKPSDLATLVVTKAKEVRLKNRSIVTFQLPDYSGVEISAGDWKAFGKAAKLDKYLESQDKTYILEELLEVAKNNQKEEEKQEKEELLKWLRSL